LRGEHRRDLEDGYVGMIDQAGKGDSHQETQVSSTRLNGSIEKLERVWRIDNSTVLYEEGSHVRMPTVCCTCSVGCFDCYLKLTRFSKEACFVLFSSIENDVKVVGMRTRAEVQVVL